MNTSFMAVLITHTFEFFPTVFTNILPLKVDFYVLISFTVRLEWFVTDVACCSLTDAWGFTIRRNFKDLRQILHDIGFWCLDIIILLQHFQMTEGTSLSYIIIMWQLTFIFIKWAWLYYPNEKYICCQYNSALMLWLWYIYIKIQWNKFKGRFYPLC